ncbi:hypothetical protein TSTA_116640 [Talaromyces stipitatus ATCC 10500]|uniref:Uncharacterized protein n=1 Tax=Talaromyces stipitatus (strain ATCC 10500 / CBS 375.48 / QM 6759 / NRRL 1006) TaxID=441959 RepID=B8MBL1_TALSN|nr:uncharacterized protein TSTA_116640 [Talaromyces stipitatus ATCC 10500]EED17875.1 hypothetical protein TSTA_116640 [Talaromyces stipitatus ATCC 10500]
MTPSRVPVDLTRRSNTHIGMRSVARPISKTIINCLPRSCADEDLCCSWCMRRRGLANILVGQSNENTLKKTENYYAARADWRKHFFIPLSGIKPSIIAANISSETYLGEGSIVKEAWFYVLEDCEKKEGMILEAAEEEPEGATVGVAREAVEVARKAVGVARKAVGVARKAVGVARKAGGAASWESLRLLRP